MSERLPYFEFYIGDWMKNPNLRRCNHTARGVWADTLCLMAECDERGVLITNQKPWTLEETACALGGNYDVTLRCLGELHQKQVMKQRLDGAYFCDWMVYHDHIRQVRKEAGSKGAEARLLKQNGSHKRKRKEFCSSKSQAKAKANCEDEDVDENEDGNGRLRERFKGREKEAEEVYAAYPHKVGRPAALTAIMRQIEKHGSEFLLKQTRAFAEARAGDVAFCPNPSTWFNQERFNDDPVTWRRSQSVNGHKQPATAIRENIKCPTQNFHED